MPLQLNENTIQEALSWVYDAAVNGIPGSPVASLGTAEELAQSYIRGNGSLADKAGNLIGWQIATAAATGFVTNIGGLITLPVAVPANIAGVLVLQLRMIAAIAHIGGYNIRDDQVRSLCYICLCGSAASDVLKQVGITVGNRMGQELVKSISFVTIKQINQAVGFRLITKFGTTGVVNLGKAVPIVGGILGGAFDGASTAIIGNVAKQMFISQQVPPQEKEPGQYIDGKLSTKLHRRREPRVRAAGRARQWRRAHLANRD